jgi:hypothetical protein
MTEREFLTKVMAMNGVAKDVADYAAEGIAKLDARNDKRKNTQTKSQKENEQYKTQICDLLAANGAMVASEIGTAMGVATQKASALCGLLVKDGKVTVADVKVKGKGTVKQYTLVPTATAEDEPSAEGEGEDTATEDTATTSED